MYHVSCSVWYVVYGIEYHVWVLCSVLYGYHVVYGIVCCIMYGIM